MVKKVQMEIEVWIMVILVVRVIVINEISTNLPEAIVKKRKE